MTDSRAPILVLTRWRPDKPNSGVSLRNCQNIKALTQLGPVDIVTIGPEPKAEPVAGIREWVAFHNKQLLDERSWLTRLRGQLWRIGLAPHPTVNNYKHPRVAAWLRERLRSHDYRCVVVEELALAAYIPLLAEHCTVVFDEHNVEAKLGADIKTAQNDDSELSPLRRLSRRLWTHMLRREEAKAVRRADLTWACSATDAETLKAAYRSGKPIVVVPNTVDTASYRRPTAVASAADWRESPLTIVFPGTFSYFPNEDAALRLIREVFPLVKARHPGSRLVLLGREPTAAMKEAAAGAADIEITGAVDSVLPYFDQPCVVALPIHVGSGTRLKILEAFALDRPVVSTRKGAEGIGARDGQEILLRESPSDIAEAVLMLWTDTRLRAELCARASELVDAEYSSKAALARIRNSLELAAGANPPGATTEARLRTTL